MKGKKLFALVLVVLLALSFANISAFASTSQKGHTVYFDNSITNYSTVYAYMWNTNNGNASNASWPGAPMTKLSDNIWGYTIDGEYDKIIFTQGTNDSQSTDIFYEANGMLATPTDTGRFNVNWSVYNGEETMPPMETSDTESGATTESTTPSTSESYTIYCKNTANWSQVNVYMWNGNGEENNASWPGVSMTDIGDGIFEYKYDKYYENVIFNSGSEQTADLSAKGDSYCFDNSTQTWELYTPTTVKINSFETSVKSPCYTNCEVVISANAQSSQGDLTYKFALIDSAEETVLYEGTNNSFVWVPTVAGKYTLKVEVTDTAQNSNSKTMDFEIKDTNLLEGVFIKNFSNSFGTTTQLKKDTAVVFTMDAIGGNIGNNLLFYKFDITKPDSTKNIAYYTTSKTYSYTPTLLGDYVVKVSVQNSNNETVTETYNYTCVSEIEEDTTAPTTLPERKNGDIDADGDIDINDATMLQKYLVHLVEIDTDYADTNKDGRVSISDVTTIQLYCADYIGGM